MRLLLTAAANVVMGMALAVLIVALAAPICIYVIYTNWKEWTL